MQVQEWPIHDPRFRPWIVLKLDGGALWLISQCQSKHIILGPKSRFASDVLTEEEAFLLLKKLGPEPDLWPESSTKIQKKNVPKGSPLLPLGN